MSEIIVAIIGFVGTIIGAVVGGFIQRGISPLYPRWLVAVGAGSGLLVGLVIGFFVMQQPDNKIFDLESSKSEDFYTVRDATFVLSDGELAVTGSFRDGTYIDYRLPKNFKVTVQLEIRNPEDQFIIGLSDGERMRPNYHFVMTQKWTAFKQQLGYDVKEGWDKYINNISDAKYTVKENYRYEIVFERKNGGVNISVNNVLVFGAGSPEVRDIGNFDHLYLTGGMNQQVIIQSLIVEKL